MNVKEFFCGLSSTIKKFEECSKQEGESCLDGRKCEQTKSRECENNSGEFKEGCTEQSFL